MGKAAESCLGMIVVGCDVVAHVRVNVVIHCIVLVASGKVSGQGDLSHPHVLQTYL
jgi:hypothetical protein